MIEVSAKVLLDSVGPNRERVTTFELVMHRTAMGHLLTYRMFARNGESDRARSTDARIREAIANPAYPLEWPRNEKGMVGHEMLDGNELEVVKIVWNRAAMNAFESASLLYGGGKLLHKGVANLLIEPFIWHRVVLTSTGYGLQNFFRQRISPLARAEIRAIATKMKKAYEASVPQELPEHGWHLPYVTNYDDDARGTLVSRKLTSAGRCARVSYLSQGKIDPIRDIEIALLLLDPAEGEPHWSPFEHVCRIAGDGDPYGVGCLPGWWQMRHDMERAHNPEDFRWLTGNR